MDMCVVDCSSGDVSTRALTSEEERTVAAVQAAGATAQAERDAAAASRAAAVAALLDPSSGFPLAARQAFAVIVGTEPPST